MSTVAVPLVTMHVSILSSLVQEEETVYLSLMVVTGLVRMQSLHVKRTVLVTYTVLDHLPVLMANATALVSLAQEKMVTVLLNVVDITLVNIRPS